MKISMPFPRSSQGTNRVALVGAGLANSLIALALKREFPRLEIELFDQRSIAAGTLPEQTWSFHDSDVAYDHSTSCPSAYLMNWLSWQARGCWSQYDVHFPKFSRTLHSTYHAVSARRLRANLRGELGHALREGTGIRQVHAHSLTLADGSTTTAALVIDGRGLAASSFAAAGYQNFFGLFVKTRRAHGLVRPILMDARIPQLGGYRFFYVLPWSDTELLVEDTRYTDEPLVISPQVLTASRRAVMAYLTAAKIEVAALDAEEYGSLPLPFWGENSPIDVSNDRPLVPGLAASGLAAGLFHPTTGYSLPDAVRFAEFVVTQVREQLRYGPLDHAAGQVIATALRVEARRVWQEAAFLRRLNNMFFKAAAPDQRWRIMAQFYGRSEELIARFYSGQLTRLDCIKLMSGKPPVPLAQGLSAFFTRFSGAQSSEVSNLHAEFSLYG